MPGCEDSKKKSDIAHMTEERGQKLFHLPGLGSAPQQDKMGGLRNLTKKGDTGCSHTCTGKMTSSTGEVTCPCAQNRKALGEGKTQCLTIGSTCHLGELVHTVPLILPHLSSTGADFK